MQIIYPSYFRMHVRDKEHTTAKSADFCINIEAVSRILILTSLMQKMHNRHR